MKQSVTDDLLSHGLVDSIQFIDVIDAVSRHSDIDPENKLIMSRTLGELRRLLESGYIYAGDAIEGPDGRYTVESWGLAPDDALVRIEERWRELKQSPSLGDVAWFELTEAGETAAKNLAQ